MFCTECGAKLEDGQKICSQCKFNLDPTIQELQTTDTVVVNDNAILTVPADVKKPDICRIIKIVIFSILALVVLIMFFYAASKIADSGQGIYRIKSTGGKTLDEAYYRQLGGIYKSYAVVARGFGVFFASVLVWLGIKK